MADAAVPQGLTPVNNIESDMKDTQELIYYNTEDIKQWLAGSKLDEELRLLNKATEEQGKKDEEKEKKQDAFMIWLKQYQKETIQRIKEVKEEFKSGLKNLGSHTAEFAIGALIGPLQLITKPLEKVLGFTFPELIKQLIGNTARRIFNFALDRTSIMKVDPGAAYVGDVIIKTFGHRDNPEDKNSPKNLFGFTSGVGLIKAATALGALAAIVGSLIWAAVDGIRGFFASKQWGTSGLAGVVGGVLGGMDSGFSGAFKNMGKWALMGAGIGTLVFPGLGTLIGGLIGAVVGGILGFIGGKNIAKATDTVIKFFSDTINNAVNIYKKVDKEHPAITGLFKDFIRKNPIVSITESMIRQVQILFKPNTTILEKLQMMGIEFFHGITFGMFRPDGFFAGIFKEINGKLGKDIKTIAGKAISGIMGIDKIIGNVVGGVIDSVTNFFLGIFGKDNKEKDKNKDIVSKILTGIMDSVMGVFKEIFLFFNYIGEKMKNKNPLEALGAVAFDMTLGGGKDFKSFSDKKEQEFGFDTKNIKDPKDIIKNDKDRLELQKAQIEEQRKTNQLLEEQKNKQNSNVNNYMGNNFDSKRTSVVPSSFPNR